MLTTTEAANAIREAYAPGFDEAVFRNMSLNGIFPPAIGPIGDTAYRWKLNSSGNDSVGTFSEGDPSPPPGNQSFSNLAVTYPAYWVYVQVTGHAKAALRSQWLNAIDEEFVLGRGDLIDLITTSTMSASSYGLEVAVDSTTTYAGQARGSAAWFESSETAVSDALSLEAMQDIRETIMNADKGGRVDAWLCNLNQETNYYRLTGQANQNTGDNDKNPGLAHPRFAERPIIGLPDFTTTVMMPLDMRPGKWVTINHRPYEVTFQGRSSDSDVWQMASQILTVDKMPKFDGKLTSVTA